MPYLDKNKSRDTMNYLAFHDCIIKNAIWDEFDLIMHFEWIDVLKSHPLNDTGKAMIAENSILRFENAKVVKSVIYDMSKVFGEMSKTGRNSCSTDEAYIVETDILEVLIEFSVLQDELTNEKGRYTWNCIGDNAFEFTIEFDHTTICWNEFKDTSWFEEWNNHEDTNVKMMLAQDTKHHNGQIEYPFPTYTDIYNKIDEMNSISKSWIRLFLNEDMGEELYITFNANNTFSCMHSSIKEDLYLTENKISDKESFLSYNEFAPDRDICISRNGINGATYRFYRYNGINKCIEWKQNNI